MSYLLFINNTPQDMDRMTGMNQFSVDGGPKHLIMGHMFKLIEVTIGVHTVEVFGSNGRSWTCEADIDYSETMTLKVSVGADGSVCDLQWKVAQEHTMFIPKIRVATGRSNTKTGSDISSGGKTDYEPTTAKKGKGLTIWGIVLLAFFALATFGYFVDPASFNADDILVYVLGMIVGAVMLLIGLKKEKANKTASQMGG